MKFGQAFSFKKLRLDMEKGKDKEKK